jgi:hypothetical protein
MASSLTIIGLVVRLKVSTYTAYGDAVYKEKSSNQNCTFVVKQFANARHECNESFKEGDLVLFGGKFTIDDKKKIMVSLILMLIVKYD